MTALKFFAKRRARKGFTLTELIVVIAIIAVLMMSVVAFAGPVRVMINNTNAKNDAITINKIVGSYMERRLAYADKITVYVGCNYDSVAAKTELDNTYADFYKKYDYVNQKNNPGMLVFHFDDSITDSLRKTFKVYDIPITKGTTNRPTLDDKYLVYNPQFFGNYEYFVTIDDTAPTTNAMKKKAYMNFRIDSYNLEGNTVDASGNARGITKDLITNYYEYIAPTTDPATVTSDPFDDFYTEKIGTENVSFALENIRIKSNSAVYDEDGDGFADTWDIETIPLGVNINRGYTVSGSSTATYEQDLIIFYNVRYYKSTDNDDTTP